MYLVLSSISIDFYDENPNWEVPKNDQDVEILGQGVLLLPPLVQKPQRAPIHNADVLNVARFVEAFKAELKLPKGSLADLQVLHCFCIFLDLPFIVRFQVGAFFFSIGRLRETGRIGLYFSALSSAAYRSHGSRQGRQS